MKNEAARLPQRIFDMFIFFAYSERCTTAARHTRVSQNCCKTRKVFVRRKLLFASHAFVLCQPQDYHKVTVRFIARLSKEYREMHSCSSGHVRRIVLSCHSLVTFAWPFCSSLSFDEIIVRTSYGCLRLDVILCEIVCDLPHGLYVLSPTTKTHDQMVVRLM